MLKLLFNKIGPWLPLVLSMGCGKQIAETASGGDHIIRDHQELPPVLSLQMKSTRIKNYTIPRNANFILPERLYARSGDATGRTLTIKYNHEPDYNEFEFHCLYQAVAKLEMVLEKCLDHYDREIGPIPTNWFPMDADKLIRMEITGPNDPDFLLDAFFTVRWK
jgi:hypothetical protein